MPAPDERDPHYSWQLIERNPVPESQKKHDLSRDAEVEVLCTEEGLGIEIVQAPLTSEEREEVAALPHVRRVTEGGYAQAYVEPPEGTRAEDNVTSGLKLAGVPEVWAEGITGSGATVAVLDTGLDSSYHDYFREVRGRSFISGESWEQDESSGHGSHVAGTAAANAEVNSRRIGAAPDASVLAGKVLSDSGSGSYAAIIKGITWAVSESAQVINLSLGGPGGEDAADHPLSLAVDSAYRKGAVVCVAAGNGQQGTEEYMADRSTPAAAREAVTVAAVDANGRIAPFSNHGRAVDVAAVGVEVPSLGGVLSGTSMASPHVGGIAALLCGAGYSAPEVRQSILSGARDTALPVHVEGHGIARAPEALRRLGGEPDAEERYAFFAECLQRCWNEWREKSRSK